MTNIEIRPPQSIRTRLLKWQGLLWLLLIAAMAAVTGERLATAYATYSGTFDEPFHVASGMEWLDKGAYTLTWDHPPLARIAMAFGPWLSGARFSPRQKDGMEGNTILLSQGDYQHTLTLARLGNVPFLMLASLTIFLWARRWFTPAAGVFALIFFLSMPPVIGHAAVATLDIPCTATFVFALYQLMRWLEDPSWRRCLIFAVACSAALATKFSSIPFLAVCCAILAATRWLNLNSSGPYLPDWKTTLKQAGGFTLTVSILLWAVYRFTVVPVFTDPADIGRVDHWFASTPFLRAAAHRAITTPLPLMQFFAGIAHLVHHDKVGTASYLLGQSRSTGWWYFFPVVIAVRTPLTFLAAAIGGTVFLLRRRAGRTWQQAATAIFPVGIILLCMASRLDMGIRYILPVYPILAIVAGYAVSFMLRRSSPLLLRSIAAILVIGTLADAYTARPDDLAWFNQIAGQHPERILAESDLDWGQDLRGLSVRLRSLGVARVGIAYFGTAPLNSVSLPEHFKLSPSERASGYVAVSIHFLTIDNATSGAYEWLKPYTPIERIGNSIFLYRIAPDQR